MAKVKVVLEFWDHAGEPTTRWEQQCAAEKCGAFQLLGRAFELAQRDTGVSFQEALAALLKGASLQKADVIEALQRVDER
ncbi:MAG: hypothetical protein ACTHN5_04885 [Phycisphaerae bacterium]